VALKNLNCIFFVKGGPNVFVCRPDEESGFLEGQPYECVAQFEQTAPGDFLFFYRDQESEEDGGEEERLKGEISAAYEKVASTAHMEGSLRYVVLPTSVADPVICYFFAFIGLLWVKFRWHNSFSSYLPLNICKITRLHPA
jgi:hypothetical protein